MAEIKFCGKYQGPVNNGEERLLNFLKVNLPDDYYLLPGIEIPNLNPKNGQVQYLEMDCLVITPHAIYNIENKDYAGRLEGDDNFWYHKDREMRNPHKTVGFKSRVLASKLKAINHSYGRAWVQSLVTLSHPLQNTSGIWGDHVKATFLLNEKLIQHITNPYNVSKLKDDIKDIYLSIRDEICGTAQQRKPSQKREIEGYEIIEILDQDQNYTEYLAKPKGVTSAVRKRIKEYALDLPSLPEELREKREKQIKNQYVALSRIKTNPFILNVSFKIDDEAHRFFEITDYLDENSLRAELKRKTFTFQEKLSIIDNLITALTAAHAEGIYHRDVSPENIYLTGGYACLGNFGKSFFIDHHSEGYTVQATLTEQTATAYHAVELLQKDSYPSSDIYSLGVLAYELFVGKVPFASPFELIKLGSKLPDNLLPSHVNPALPKWLDELCNQCIRTSPEDRWVSLKEMQDFLAKQSIAEVPKEETKSAALPAAEQTFDVGSRILDYTIYGKLGSGGYSQVYKVKHSLRSNTIYALKVFHESVHASSVMDEYQALVNLQHPNIVKFVWNGTLPSSQFYTLMEYLDGENLKDYAKGEKRLPLFRVYQVAKDILSALVEMQGKNPPLYHRDIKPQNIVFDNEDRFVLIDFNVASALENNKEHVGTHPYLAPDLVADGYKVNWDKSADPFALGITLYELACKAYPWNGSIKMPLLEKPPVHPREINSSLSDEFADFLFKAIQPRFDDRFKDAVEMLAALEAIGDKNILKAEPTPIEEGKKDGFDGEDFVSYLNTLFSQSRHGNAGTRAGAKEEPFDELTYTPTKLDSKLIPDILDGKYKLVIITGNAGDGKTAFIKKIENKAQNKQPLQNKNGAKFIIEGVNYQSNYDGSQDEAERINDQVLKEFFEPFENLSSYSRSKEGRIIAINEGRLVEFLKTSGKFEGLANKIDEYFYKAGSVDLPEGLLIINLNLRSIVASSINTISLFKAQIQKLTDKQLWTKCTTCALAEKCFIKYNVDTLSDTAAGDEIINRLEWLIRIVALKRELHITMRDLRSFISFLLTRDYNCTEIPALHDRIQNNSEWWKLHYFNVTAANADDNGNQDRLVRLLRETDIAAVSTPNLDRDLFFGNHKDKSFIEFADRTFSLLSQFNASKVFVASHDQTEDVLNNMLELHRVFKRHQFFEGKINFLQRLPYRSAPVFHSILIPGTIANGKHEAMLRATLKNISKAISLNEGCDRAEIYSKYLVLSSAHINDPFGKSFRLFPLSDFELVINESTHLVDYLEYEPDSLTFRSISDKKVSLSVSLDLYEMLSFIGKGYSPSLNDLKGRFVELQIFKNLLENKPYKEVVVTRDNRELYMVSYNETNQLQIKALNLSAS